jgi:uncharacterized protein DUF5324
MIGSGPVSGWGPAGSGKDPVNPMLWRYTVSRLSALTDRAHTEANLAQLKGRAADAAEALAPRVQHARELAEPYVATALDKVEPYVSTARDKVEPYVNTAMEKAGPYVTTAKERLTPVAEQALASSKDIARDKIKPGYEHALETTRETVVPAVAAAVAAAAASSAPVRNEAKVRGSAALAALRGETSVRRSRRWPLVGAALLLGAVLGAIGSEVVRRMGSRGITVSPTPLRPNTVIIPDPPSTKAQGDPLMESEPVSSDDE